MKKLLSLLLVLLLTLSLMGVLTSCGGEETVDTETVSQEDAETEETDENASVFPEALSGFEALAVEGMENTTWSLAGGMFNGVEMEVADVQLILDACGGRMDFSFLEDNSINLINGEQTYEGTYTLVSDGYIIDAEFDGYAYYGVLTPVGDITALVMVNKNNSEKALYFSQVE